MGEYLNIYRIIHSFVVYACCWSMLLCILCYALISLWTGFLVCFQVLNFQSKTKYSTKHDNWKWSILEWTCSQHIFVFWSWNCAVLVKTRQWCARSSLLRIFMVWPDSLPITPPFFKILLNYFRTRPWEKVILSLKFECSLPESS